VLAADTVVHVGASVAQAQLGYIVPAPPPKTQDADAWRLLLYILSHGYEGRLGKKAISDAGLAYYIDGRYRSDGTNAWVTLSTGVDPENVEPLRALLTEELQRLSSEPPTDAEFGEAREHMIGRLSSEAQSNAELTSRLATDWLWYGKPVTADALQRRLQAVTREDLLSISAAFASGAILLVTE
jgi:predicted Zn-dependent peptidase